MARRKQKAKVTGEIPLKFAKFLTSLANRDWDKGSFLKNVSLVTGELLNHWFSDEICSTREYNFHEGQRQAILNTIYLHEVLDVKNVHDMYMKVQPELLQDIDLLNLKQDKYNHPKYAVKMATGTGKTWVLNALLLWQYLNAKYHNESSIFSKNFLIVAPGLIVYERLLDAFLGKERIGGTRDFDESDFRRFEKLFVPPTYKEEIFGFIQNNVMKRDEISRKVTGEGLIAITNWHRLKSENNNLKIDDSFEDPTSMVKDVLPVSPSKTAGNDLSALDNQYLKGKEIEYLAELPDLVVFNDEAHHIHDVKRGGEVFEVEWQKSLLKISEPKKDKFIQIDFSATPYIQARGKQKVKNYFPHIIVDFDLKTAIWGGLVKTIAIDKRKTMGAKELDYNAEREGRRIIGLSEGQKIMLSAGLTKLKILEDQFVSIDESKHPKMLVMCEETGVVPYTIQFLKSQGLEEEDIMEIHSNKKGDVTEKEWEQLKQRLFNIDKHQSPKVIVSVLMLREGFDVNNICIIVPLRATTTGILLEQTVGRGLRLMWREKEYEDVKIENRFRLLNKKQEPINYYDLLSIVEHPEFMRFYDDLIEGGAVVSVKEDISRESILGDIIKVGLKDDYEEYDFFWPVIVQDREENLVPTKLSYENLKPFELSLEELKKIVPKDDIFQAEEITVRTRFGEYAVNSSIFTAKNYNEFLQKLVNGVSSQILPVSKRKSRNFPMMQINRVEIAGLADNYIRHRLFNQEFDPTVDNNWRVLLLAKSGIIEHITKNIGKEIYKLQNNIDIKEAKVLKTYFSKIEELKMRENYSMEVSKAIYERLPYPSQKGGFERNFMLFVDRDSEVNSFIKINEIYHDFARITYIREDGLLARYFPDFLVNIEDKIYIVETKAQKDVQHPNVLQKRQATVDWVAKINELNPKDRMNAKWVYVLLSEQTFYDLEANGASTFDILEFAKGKVKIDATLDSYMEK